MSIKPICSVEGCGNAYYGRSFCAKHYREWRKSISATLPRCSVEGCGRPNLAYGLCSRHYQRWVTYGDPKGGGTERGEPLRYLFEEVLPYDGDECIFWKYSRTTAGYPTVTIDGKVVYGHRFVCEKANGPPPSRKHDAAHECGNGHMGCVTKRHLRWATRKENVEDMVKHGTSRKCRISPVAKLTEADVREIRLIGDYLSALEIAKMFGVSRAMVSLIKSRKSWGWLD